eukprot:2862807-Pyramimonas_sp.AAC.1
MKTSDVWGSSRPRASGAASPSPLGVIINGRRGEGGVCRIGGGTACERHHWGLRWSSLRGHDLMASKIDSRPA